MADDVGFIPNQVLMQKSFHFIFSRTLAYAYICTHARVCVCMHETYTRRSWECVRIHMYAYTCSRVSVTFHVQKKFIWSKNKLYFPLTLSSSQFSPYRALNQPWDLEFLHRWGTGARVACTRMHVYVYICLKHVHTNLKHVCTYTWMRTHALGFPWPFISKNKSLFGPKISYIFHKHFPQVNFHLIRPKTTLGFRILISLENRDPSRKGV